ncbi:MAG: hypothetical protein JNM56_05210 [Planctomycetia bacterium]|nr:hypothetical protein [Planctomycetia bacterium]
MIRRLPAVLALVLLAPPALACTLCPNLQATPTLRKTLGDSKLVLYGTLKNPKLNAATNTGTVDLEIENVLKNDPFVTGKKTVTLNRYIPVDPKNPPRYLVFCEVDNGKLDPYRGVELKSNAAVDYVRGASALNPKDPSAALLYFFRYIDHGDPEIANDAFLEFAKADDREVGEVAKKLDPEKMRKLLNDPQTPPARIGLYAFLLGACGGDKEAAQLRSMLDKPSEKAREAIDGILAGYIQLRPREGWQLAGDMLKDTKERSIIDRTRIIQTLRFYHGWKPKESKPEVLTAMKSALGTDLADLALEDLRKWEWWEETATVLSLYGKKGYEAPLMRRAIIRYALNCPRPDAAEFIKERRAKEADLVKEVEDNLKFEKIK